GMRVQGKVRNLTDFGAFVELEPGVEGLLHISDMSWTRNIGHPSELLKKGQPVETQILNVDRDNKRISLGLKQIQPDPWETVSQRYPMGSRVTGKVVRLTDFGAFVELEPGVDGLLHISQMSNRPIATPADILNVGDELTLMVIRGDPNQRRRGVSLKELAPIIDEPVQSEGRGRHKGRKRRGGDDYDEEEQPRVASRGRAALIALGAGVGVLVLFVVTVWLLLAVTDDGLPGGAKVAVGEVEGLIGAGADRGLDTDAVIRTLGEYRDDPAVRAVVLRINSPGGVVAPTQEIFTAVRRLREAKKPVAASLGSVAASGGYYVAVAADRIYASP